MKYILPTSQMTLSIDAKLAATFIYRKQNILAGQLKLLMNQL
jgi:hypothetical protein